MEIFVGNANVTYICGMNISYSTTTAPGSLRTIHIIVIENERFETTRATEILVFAKPRIFSKRVWKQLRECVRLGESLQIMGGGLFGDVD